MNIHIDTLHHVGMKSPNVFDKPLSIKRTHLHRFRQRIFDEAIGRVFFDTHIQFPSLVQLR